MTEYGQQRWLAPFITSHLDRLVKWKGNRTRQLYSTVYGLEDVPNATTDDSISDNGSGLVIRVDKILKTQVLFITELKTVVASYHVTLSDGHQSVTGILYSGSFRSDTTVTPLVGHVLRPSSATLHVTPMGSTLKQIRLDIKRCRHIITPATLSLPVCEPLRSDSTVKKCMVKLLALYNEELFLQTLANDSDEDEDNELVPERADHAEQDDFPDEGGLQDVQDDPDRHVAGAVTDKPRDGLDEDEHPTQSISAPSTDRDMTSFATQVPPPPVLQFEAPRPADPVPRHARPIPTKAMDILDRLNVKHAPARVEADVLNSANDEPKPESISHLKSQDNSNPNPRASGDDGPGAVSLPKQQHDFEVFTVDSSVHSQSPPAPTVPNMVHPQPSVRQPAKSKAVRSRDAECLTAEPDSSRLPIPPTNVERPEQNIPGPIFHSGTRRPDPKYVKYAQRRLPPSQRALLEKDTSWLPSLPSRRFPPSNVPIDVLRLLPECETRVDKSKSPSPGQATPSRSAQNDRSTHERSQMPPGTPAKSEDNASQISWSVTPSERLKRTGDLPPDSSAIQPSPSRDGSEDGLQQSAPKPLMQSPSRIQDSGTSHAPGNLSPEPHWIEDVVGAHPGGSPRSQPSVDVPWVEDLEGDRSICLSKAQPASIGSASETPRSDNRDGRSRNSPTTSSTGPRETRGTQGTSSHDSKASPVVYVKATQTPGPSRSVQSEALLQIDGQKRPRPYEWSQDPRWDEDPAAARKRQRLEALEEIRQRAPSRPRDWRPTTAASQDTRRSPGPPGATHTHFDGGGTAYDVRPDLIYDDTSHRRSRASPNFHRQRRYSPEPPSTRCRGPAPREFESLRRQTSPPPTYRGFDSYSARSSVSSSRPPSPRRDQYYDSRRSSRASRDYSQERHHASGPADAPRGPRRPASRTYPSPPRHDLPSRLEHPLPPRPRRYVERGDSPDGIAQSARDEDGRGPEIAPAAETSPFGSFAASFARLGKRPDRNAFSNTSSVEVMTRHASRSSSARRSTVYFCESDERETVRAGGSRRFDVLGAKI